MKANNNTNVFTSLPILSDEIFPYLSSTDWRNVARTSKEMNQRSFLFRLKKAKKLLADMRNFQGIIPILSFDPTSNNLAYYNSVICSTFCSIHQKIKSNPIFQEIFESKRGALDQTAQEIKDRDLAIAFQDLLPLPIRQQIEGRSNAQAAAWIRNWLKNLPPQDDFFLRKEINLSFKQLLSIPQEIFLYCPLLERLYLHNNKIQIIPKEIGQLQHLHELDLAQNEIQVIPPEIRQLQNLQFLQLNYNQINEIPPEIGYLRNLQGLHIRENNIRDLPREIGLLQNLQIITLDYHKIQNIPVEIIPMLQHLLGDAMFPASLLTRLKRWGYAHRPSKTICIAVAMAAIVLVKMFYSAIELTERQ